MGFRNSAETGCGRKRNAKRGAHIAENNARTCNRTCVSGLRSKYRWGGNYSLATARRSVPHPASEDRIDDGRGSHPVRFWSGRFSIKGKHLDKNK